jgi:hypothetical protein
MIPSLGLLAQTTGPGDPPDPAVILDRAFEKRFDADLTSEIELVMEDRNGRQHRRIFDAAAKLIGGRHHSIGKLNWPHHLRDMAILTIEADDRDHDAFVYLPTLGRVRRISSSQKGDAFFGTDVTYEDLERQRIEDLEIVEVETTTTQGEPSYRIRVKPRERRTYVEADYFVATADDALLEIHYFREGGEGAFRTVTSPRKDMRIEGGHIVPARLVVHNLSRRTTTTATFRNLRLDPEIDDHLFSVTMLERNPELRQHTGPGAEQDASR